MKRNFLITTLVFLCGVGTCSLVLVLWFELRGKKWETPDSSPRLSKSVTSSEGLKHESIEVGIKFVQSKELVTAKKIFERLNESEPANASILNNLGYVEGELGDRKGAENYYRKAIQIDERCKECLNNLGTLMLQDDRIAEAKKMFEGAVAIDGDYADPMLNLAVLFEKDDEWDSALDWFRKAETRITDSELKKWVGLRVHVLSQLTTTPSRTVTCQ